jgi:3'(2'), 5'-bisphosphate nucleotidase
MLKTIKIEEIIDIALQAGQAVMEIYQKDFTIEYKDDTSPLTEADIKANEIICQALTKLYPNIPILSEENKSIEYSERKDWEYYWCIDPIDGTKEFIKKNDEFTINIALIGKDTPLLGVVYAPALAEVYYAKQGEGAFRRVLSVKWEVLSKERLPIHVNDKPTEELAVVASKSHLSDETQAFIDSLALNTEHLTLTSRGSSLKLCMVATGEADIYPRLAPTMEWDTAAADAIVREAGKMSYQFESNNPMVYNKENLLNPWFVVR